MPELPEVEVLARHLRPQLLGARVRGVELRRLKVIRPTPADALRRSLMGARLIDLRRRAKYLVFTFKPGGPGAAFVLLGHLGLTGRIFTQPRAAPLPRHAAVVLDLGTRLLVYEDSRYFGRFTLDTSALGRLGPEPLEREFRARAFHAHLGRSRQAIKVKLLDQTLLAGVGNIYASEALHRARLDPRKPACRISLGEAAQLWRAIRSVLRAAIRFGSTVPLDWAGVDRGDGLFYFGAPPGGARGCAERLQVYDRAGQPCARCGTLIRRVLQAQRSTYFCPACQTPRRGEGLRRPPP